MNKSLCVALVVMSAAVCPVYATQNASLKLDTSTDAGGNALQGMYAISSKHINRIVTPFKNPSIKIDDLPDTGTEIKGNIVYLSTKLENIDIAGFITETGDENSSIRVIFKPMPLPPQEIVLKPQTSYGSQVARDFEQSNPRTLTIAEVMSTLARGELPIGYSMSNPALPFIPTECYQNGLVFDFYSGQLASGGDYVVAIGTVHNTSDHVIKYDVTNCYGNEGVVANSSFPYDAIAPNQKSEAFVMYYRNRQVVKQTPKRRSLLGE